MTLTRAMRVLGATTLAGALLLTAAPASSADQVRDDQWANAYFGLDKVWSVSKGDGVIVAVIDSGVDGTHPDLAGSVLPGHDPSGRGLEAQPTDPHGTNMASLIAGHGHGSGDGVVGLAPGAKILPIYKKGTGDTDAIADGIHWAVDHRAKVINISLGGEVPPGSDPDLTAAIAYALQHDVLIVGSSGNTGRSAVDSPANEPGVLAVGATDKNGAIWSKSDYGPQVMLTAPGVHLVAGGACSGSQYCLADGTSGSSAYVAGAAALVRAKFPNLTAGQVANRLVKSAKAPAALQGGKLPDPHYGYGILSPYDALTKDIPAGSAQGPLAAGAPAADPAASSSAGGGTGSGDSGGLPTIPDASKNSSSSGVAVLAAVAAVVVLLIVVIAVVVARSRRRPGPVPPQGQAPYGAQPGWPAGPPYGNQPQPPYGGPPQAPYGNQAPPPGYPPQQGHSPQQGPYQNPYGPGGNQAGR